MNVTKIRSKRIILPTVAAVAVLGVGGTVWSATASEQLPGDERDRVGSAATEAVGGTVVEVETSDDAGEAYEVEVRMDDGTQLEVVLDENLEVIAQAADDRDDDGDDGEDADDDESEESESDDRALSDAERTAAEKAALAAVGGGTVLDVEADDDGGAAYEVEVRDQDGTEWDVELDADHQVLDKTAEQ